MRQRLRFFSPAHNITEVYLNQILYGIAVSLIAVFIPLFLIDLGYSIKQALLYLLVVKVFMLLGSPFAAWLNSTLGFKHTIVIRIPFFIASFLSLYSLAFTNLHYFIPAMITGVSTVLYWIPLHNLFFHYSHPEKRGKEVSILQSLPALFKVGAPAIGGIIAVQLGFPTLILIGLMMVFVSTIPLFLSPELKSPKFKWKDLVDFRHHKFIAMTFGDGFAFVAVAYLFPIFIFTTLGSTETVGYIESLGTLIYALTTLALGRIIDKQNRINWLLMGAVLWSATIFVRPFLSTAIGFAGIIIVASLVFPFYNISYSTLFYQYAHSLGEKGDEFIVAREMFLNLARIAALGLAIIFPYTYGFFFATIALLIASFVMKRVTYNAA